ncbi:hypothetical protein L6452_26465 [Arctium lappa]|uniref:Uncharacterized protein n=1 Tax=Arctium lappa TaxID=4217 RepID=A0ACB8ZVL7_ARCLA|nr:hypothetical protein L6452_26465 [Arctium lappa]
MAMAHSGDSVAVDMPQHLIEKEHIISTGHGPVSVIVYGDQEKPPLITYPDLALNHTSCFRQLFFCPESASLLLHNFCIYHITPPGHELGAASISIDDSVPTAEDFSDQILEVLNHFRLGSVMCMGVMAGAYILTLFALKYSERVTGLILVSPLCRAPTWNEWLCNKFMSNLLYYYGMTDLLKEFLLHRYFSKGVCGSLEVPELDIVRKCRKLLGERNSINVWRYLQAIHRRPDITEELKNLECRTIIFVGDSSPFHTEALHMTAKLGRKCCALVEVQACGSIVTAEQPHAMLIPLEYFLKGYGLYRSCWFNNGLRSCLGLTCIDPDLLSPKSMGVKLKRIKTRVSPPPPRTHQS